MASAWTWTRIPLTSTPSTLALDHQYCWHLSHTLILFTWTSSQIAGAMQVAKPPLYWNLKVIATISNDFCPHIFTIINSNINFAQYRRHVCPTKFCFPLVKKKLFSLPLVKNNFYFVWWKSRKTFEMFSVKQTKSFSWLMQNIFLD